MCVIDAMASSSRQPNTPSQQEKIRALFLFQDLNLIHIHTLVLFKERLSKRFRSLFFVSFHPFFGKTGA